MVSASAKREKGIEVRFEQVGRRDLVAAVTASGKIQPKKKVDISADITGRITRIAVREGDLVQKGQFLLQIDPTIYQATTIAHGHLLRVKSVIKMPRRDVRQRQKRDT